MSLFFCNKAFMLLHLFGKGSAETAAFARSLAVGLTKRYPPELDVQPNKRPSAARLTRIVEETCNKAVTYKQEKKLGWIGRAKLANEFRWALTDSRYSKEFVEFATEAMTVYLHR